MATLLADSPTSTPAAPDADSSAQGRSDPHANGASGLSPRPAPGATQRACAKCGAAMAGDQDWCLQCGAGAPGSLGSPSWRSATAIIGATAILALAAAAAAYAALNRSTAPATSRTAAVARATPTAPAGTAATPTAPPGSASTPTPAPSATTPGAATKPPNVSAGFPAIKPPKIPLKAVLPNTSSKTSTPSSSTGTGTSTATTPSTPKSGGSGAEESAPTSILLDTNAASTYNPYGYPSTGFGDPSLAIDGDPSTGWTAAVEAAAAPKMAVGLLIDMKIKQRLSSMAVVTSTPGAVVQVYGANGHTAPTSITDPAWVALSHSTTLAKKRTRLKLRWSGRSGKTFTFVTLWISSAPRSSTQADPGRVTVNELELFPAS